MANCWITNLGSHDAGHKRVKQENCYLGGKWWLRFEVHCSEAPEYHGGDGWEMTGGMGPKARQRFGPDTQTWWVSAAGKSRSWMRQMESLVASTRNGQRVSGRSHV